MDRLFSLFPESFFPSPRKELEMISFQSSLGIDIRDNCFIVVHLKGYLNQISLVDQALIPFKNGASQKEKEEAICNGIQSFLKEKRIRRVDEVFFGIPRSMALIKCLTMRLAVEENLAQVLEYEIEKHIPFLRNEVCFDFQVTFRDKTANKLHILLSIIKKDLLFSFIDLAKRSDVELSGIEISSTAIYNSFFLISDQKEKKGIFGLVDITSSRMEVNLLDRGILVHSRTIPLREGISLSRQVMENLRLSLEGCESFSPSSSLLTEGHPLSVFISGTGLSRELIQNLSQEKGIILNLARGENLTINSKDQDLDFPVYLPAISLALKGFNSPALDINLVPPDSRKKKKKGAFFLLILFSSLVIILGFTWIGSVAVKKRIELRKINARIDELYLDVEKVEKMKKEYQELLKRETIFKKSIDISKLEILKELTEIIPLNAWATELQYKEGTIEISGEAESASTLISILEESPLFSDVKFIAPIVKRGQGKEKFKIKATVVQKK